MWKSILEKSVCVHNAVFSSCENRRKSTTSFLNHQIKIGKIWPKITFYSNKHPFYNNSLPQRHLYIDINLAQFSCLHRENLLRILVLSVPQKEIVFHTEDNISHRNHRNHRKASPAMRIDAIASVDSMYWLPLKQRRWFSPQAIQR